LVELPGKKVRALNDKAFLRSGPRKDKRGFDLISDALPFGRLWYGELDAIRHGAKFHSRSHRAVIRVYDAPGNVIQTHEPPSASSESHEHQSKASLVTSPPAVSTGDTLLVEITMLCPLTVMFTCARQIVGSCSFIVSAKSPLPASTPPKAPTPASKNRI
jgi:hypothetical protein